MAYGDGCVREVRDGTWRVRVDFGTDPRTGKRSICSRNVKGTREDAENLREELLARRALGHASASFTLDMYAHAPPSNDALAARLMADLVRLDRSPMAPGAVLDEAPQ